MRYYCEVRNVPGLAIVAASAEEAKIRAIAEYIKFIRDDSYIHVEEWPEDENSSSRR